MFIALNSGEIEKSQRWAEALQERWSHPYVSKLAAFV
jgi:hypothetical protein